MDNDRPSNTGITNVVEHKDSSTTPLMSYTAVTTHSEMAAAFVNQLLNLCHKLIPEKQMNIEDLITICHAALEGNSKGVTLLEGKYLRGRISEQLARTKRYNEPFSMICLKLKNTIIDATYESTIDVLRERMRRSDQVFMFKYRILIILPHTTKKNTIMLLERIRELMAKTFETTPLEAITYLPFPDPQIKRSSQVLDWAEDQLR